MAEPQPTSSSEETSVTYVSEIDPLDSIGTIIPVEQWFIAETISGGWTGFAKVDPGVSGQVLTPGDALASVLSYRLLPGNPLALGLWMVVQTTNDNDDDDQSVAQHAPEAPKPISLRTWPSIITQLATAPGGDSIFDTVCHVYFTDIITFLRGTSIWGVFKECSPGELLGAALSLATGGTGQPTLTPALPIMPQIRINDQSVRESARWVPYAIATGEPMGQWIDGILGRLGVRIEMIGHDNGSVEINLRDRTPDSATALSMTVDAGGPNGSNAVISAMSRSPRRPMRSTLLDTVSVSENTRFGSPSGSFESLMYSASTSSDEAEYRTRFGSQKSLANLHRVSVITGNPGLYPGRMISFKNRTIHGIPSWQVIGTRHGVSDGAYRNTASLIRSGIPWRPAIPEDTGPIVISGVVDDGVSKAGATVLRDRLGRIPMSFRFIPGQAEAGMEFDEFNLFEEKEDIDEKVADAAAGDPGSFTSGDESNTDTTNQGDDGNNQSGDSNPSGDNTGTSTTQPEPEPEPEPEDTEYDKPVRIPLAVIEPMAGGVHGFLPAHRQGDICRVSVQHPMHAEVVGFMYNESRQVGQEAVDASMGMIVRHSPTEWSGFMFRPQKDVEEEEAREKANADDGDSSNEEGGDSNSET